MAKLTVFVTLALLLTSSAWAATIEWQGGNGSLNNAASWYIITDAGNPSSRTGVTRMPVKYTGTYPGTMGDYALIRNGTTTTVDSSVNSQDFVLGGPQITGQTSGPATTMYVVSGGTLSLYSDDIDNGANLAIGSYYGGTVSMTGGFVDVYGRRAASTVVVGSSAAGGVLSMSGGLLQLRRAIVASPEFNVGGGSGAKGYVNQSGGTIKISGAFEGSPYITIGLGGYGEYNLSGGHVEEDGTVHVGYEDGTTPGTGVLNVSGGNFWTGYRMVVGDGATVANVGVIRVTGGTLGGHEDGHIWLGRGMNETQAVPGSVGKMVLSQSGHLLHRGFFMGINGHTTDSTQMELKINSMSNFDFFSEEAMMLAGTLEVSLTDGFRPTPGAAWKMAAVGLSHPAWAYTVDFDKVTPGFHAEKRGNDVYLVCDSLMRPGDANNDGAVNVGDLGILAANWQQQTILGKSWAEGDFTGDDVVNVGDLGVLAANWGWSGAPADSDAPEPASLALLALGAIALIRRRRG